MTKQTLPQVGVLSDAACCEPLVHEPLTPQQAGTLAARFKALGDPVRLRLLSMIASHAGGEVCVCDLTDRFDLTGPTISHHLRVLREAGLIDCQRRGTWVYYWLQSGVLDRLAAVLDTERLRAAAAGAVAAAPAGAAVGTAAEAAPVGAPAGASA